VRLIHAVVTMREPADIVNVNLGLVTTPLALIASILSTNPFNVRRR
jgi:hypothetical protein